MMETATKLNGTIDDALNMSMNMALKAGGIDMLKSMDEEGLAMFKACFKIVDAYKEYIIKEAKTLNEINDKLDNLLSKTES